MSATAVKHAILATVAMANDQTDGLVTLLENGYRDETTIALTITHLRFLQRNFAKAADSEISYMEMLEQYLQNK